jgi:hypothetical protein
VIVTALTAQKKSREGENEVRYRRVAIPNGLPLRSSFGYLEVLLIIATFTLSGRKFLVPKKCL